AGPRLHRALGPGPAGGSRGGRRGGAHRRRGGCGHPTRGADGGRGRDGGLMTALGTRRRTVGAVAAVLAAAAVLTACGQDESEGTWISGDLTVGAATQTDLQIIGEL